MRAVPWGSLAFGLLTAFAAVAAEPGTTVTLLEGDASIIRGTARYALAEGVRLASGDIVEVTDKGLMVIEFPDGTELSLGPRTRMLALGVPARGAKGAGAEFYVVQGVYKHASAKQPSGAYRYIAPLATFSPTDANAVVLYTPGEASVFIETGEARITEPVPKGATATPMRIKTGDFYSRKADQKSALAPRPPQAFIAALPRSFLDPLPSRMARYQEREVNPRLLGEVSYAEVELWLKAPPELRKPFFARFLPKTNDPAFRAALAANVRFHMEWDPILFPEKYKPKPDPAEATSDAPKAARTQ